VNPANEVIDRRQLGGLDLGGMNLGSLHPRIGLDGLDISALTKAFMQLDWGKMFNGVDLTRLGTNAIDQALSTGLLAASSSMLPQHKLAKKIEMTSDLKTPGAKKVQLWFGPIKVLTTDEVGL
jgi:hypothetical protein